MEYMHTVMLGVVNFLLSLWTDPAHSRGILHDVEPHVHLINSRIEFVQVCLLIVHIMHIYCGSKYTYHHHIQPPPPPHSASNSRTTTCDSRVNVLVGDEK